MSLCIGKPIPKSKAKAKSASTKRGKGNPAATWELKKVKASDLKNPLPKLDRAKMKKSLEKEVAGKVRIVVFLFCTAWCFCFLF